MVSRAMLRLIRESLASATRRNPSEAATHGGRVSVAG